ncbi:MAG: hypothetical protein JNJ46_04930 [Myxococcales bacterium]|nr:hypothetical protein [Myxococcales bacterium]
MNRRNTLPRCLISSISIASLITFTACDDYSTGQDAEPPGPLKVERLTLSDGHQFIDTSAPADCEDAKLKDTPECLNNPFKDNFSIKKHPPTPDHATKLRVVFNKLPLKLNGVDVEGAPADGKLPKDISELQLRDPSVIKLECDGCTGIPAAYTSLQLAGSALSPDPTTFDYGPALQMEVLPSLPGFLMIADDPLRALEPNTTYRVVLNPGLSGRNAADKVLLDDRAKSLLTFTTQPFAVVDTQDADVIKTDNEGHDVPVGLSNSGALVITLNAGVDHTRFQAGTVQAAELTVNGAKMTVPVVFSNTTTDHMSMTCEHGNQRRLFVAPTSGTWVNSIGASDTVTLKVVIRGSDIRDVAQDSAHTPGMGRNSLSEDITVNATIVADPAMDAEEHLRETAVPAADVTACVT